MRDIDGGFLKLVIVLVIDFVCTILIRIKDPSNLYSVQV